MRFSMYNKILKLLENVALHYTELDSIELPNGLKFNNGILVNTIDDGVYTIVIENGEIYIIDNNHSRIQYVIPKDKEYVMLFRLGYIFGELDF